MMGVQPPPLPLHRCTTSLQFSQVVTIRLRQTVSSIRNPHYKIRGTLPTKPHALLDPRLTPQTLHRAIPVPLPTRHDSPRRPGELIAQEVSSRALFPPCSVA